MPGVSYMMGSQGTGFNCRETIVMRDAPEPADEAVKRRIREGGKRARAEAEARKKAAAAHAPAGTAPPKEVGGRDGPDPVRHGDWEVKGVASDF
jgi:hypothetical protein